MRIVGVMLALAGCFKPDPPAGIPCGSDLECPSSQNCVAGICGGMVVDPDAPIDDAPTGCWTAWLSGAPTFDAPTPISVAESTSSESNSELSEDQLTLYFERSRDIFVTHRDTVDSDWQATSLVPEFSTADNEGKVVTAANDTIAILSFATGTTTAFDLFQLERPAPGQPFANPSSAHFALVNSAVADFDPEVTADGLALYWSPGGNILKVATRGSVKDDFGAPVPVPGVSGVAADPTISPDQRVLVYSTSGAASLDLAFAVRSDATSAFGPAALLSIDSPQDDGDPELSADGCTLIYSSARTGSVGGRDLWQVKVK